MHRWKWMFNSDCSLWRQWHTPHSAFHLPDILCCFEETTGAPKICLMFRGVARIFFVLRHTIKFAANLNPPPLLPMNNFVLNFIFFLILNFTSSKPLQIKICVHGIQAPTPTTRYASGITKYTPTITYKINLLMYSYAKALFTSAIFNDSVSAPSPQKTP